MLEILFVSFLCKTIGKQCRDKGQGPLLYQVLMVIFWIVGEIGGAIVGAAATDGEGPAVYVMALVGAACGTGLAFGIVAMLPENKAAKIYSGGPRKVGGIGPPGSGPAIGPPGSAQASMAAPMGRPRSDADAQAAMKQAQECEAGQRWGEAVKHWQTVAQTAVDPTLLDYGRKRSVQLEQWLSQQLNAGR